MEKKENLTPEEWLAKRRQERGGIDTRNYMQRQFDKNYANKGLNEQEVAKMQANRQTELDYLYYLSNTYGFTRLHSRSRDKVYFQTSDIICTGKLPRVGYHRVKNRQIQKIVATVENGKIDVRIVKIKPKKTKQWKSIWFTGKNRRK